MKTTKDYKDFVLEQLEILGNINCKPMMGEYLLYYDNTLFGGLYNNRLLIKIVASNEKYQLQQQIPYDGAKPMYFIEELSNSELLKSIIIDTCKDLPKKKK